MKYKELFEGNKAEDALIFNANLLNPVGYLLALIFLLVYPSEILVLESVTESNYFVTLFLGEHFI